MAELVLELVGSRDLTLATLLLLAYDFRTNTELEDARIQRDCIFDTLEVLIDILHALDLADVGTDTLWVLADRIDLLLQPDLLHLNPVLYRGWQLRF